MTKEAASRIQRAEAKQHGGGVPKGSFGSRAQSTADKRENQSKDSGKDNQGDQRLGGEAKNPMTKEDASRIQSAEAKEHGGGVPEDGFASRAQSTADKRENQGN